MASHFENEPLSNDLYWTIRRAITDGYTPEQIAKLLAELIVYVME